MNQMHSKASQKTWKPSTEFLQNHSITLIQDNINDEEKIELIMKLISTKLQFLNLLQLRDFETNKQRTSDLKAYADDSELQRLQVLNLIQLAQDSNFRISIDAQININLHKD